MKNLQLIQKEIELLEQKKSEIDTIENNKARILC